MADTARRTGLVLMEALGYKFHPFMKRVKEIVEKGEIGEVQSVDSRFFLPTLSGKNWRYSYAEGGGALMDTGVAALDAARHVLGDVSLICDDAKVKLAYPQVDMDCTATFLATTGAKVFVDCSIWSLGPRISMVIKGQDGAELTIRNWAMPHTVYNAILVTDRNGCKRTEKYETGEPTTYTLNVRSFIEVIRNRDTVNLGSPENAVTNMELVDSVYEKAGLVPRGRTLPTEGAEGAEGAAPAN
jgi:predicted dehydrogenase